MGKLESVVVGDQTTVPSQAAVLSQMADDLSAMQQELDDLQTRVRGLYAPAGTLLDVANQCIDNAVIGIRESALKLALGEIKR